MLQYGQYEPNVKFDIERDASEEASPSPSPYALSPNTQALLS